MHRIEAVGFLRLQVISRRGGSIRPQMTAKFVTRLQMWGESHGPLQPLGLLGTVLRVL